MYDLYLLSMKLLANKFEMLSIFVHKLIDCLIVPTSVIVFFIGALSDRSDLVYSWLNQQTGRVTQLASPCLVVPDESQQLLMSFNLTVSNQGKE